MLLRDHPLMMFQNNRSWPPDWLWRHGYDDTHPRGEVGILKNVIPSTRTGGCFLVIEHCGAEYIGALLVNDPAFSREIFRLLVRCSGKTIREIGEIDLTDTALRSIEEMTTGKNEDKFNLIANQNDKLRHELRNRLTMMQFLRDSIREQIEAKKANSQGIAWNHFEHGKAMRKIHKTF
ncbi:MAG TPA: hypothetical protein VI585_14760 [Candidatus Binatia bacterium]